METNFIKGSLGGARKRCFLIVPIIQKTIKSKSAFGIILLFISLSLSSCIWESTCHDEMISILEKYDVKPYSHHNQLYPKVKFIHTNSQVAVTYNIRGEAKLCKCLKAHLLTELGQKVEAVKVLESLAKEDNEDLQVPTTREITKIRSRVPLPALTRKK